MGLVVITSCATMLAACGGKEEKTAATGRDSATGTAQPTDVPSPSIPAAPVPTPAAKVSPESVVDSLYKVHGKGGFMLSNEGAQYRERFFDSELNALFTKNLAPNPQNEIANLDFDPFYNAQDIEISGLEIGEPKIEGESATVVVRFNNYDQKNVLTYLMRNTAEGWRIHDIDYGEGDNLFKILSQPF